MLTRSTRSTIDMAMDKDERAEKRVPWLLISKFVLAIGYPHLFRLNRVANILDIR